VPLEATPTNEAASSVQILLGKLEDLSKLEKDWDSYGATAISRPAIEEAKRLLILASAESKARRLALTAPFVAPVASGSVHLEWESSKGDLYLALEFDGKDISYFRSADDDSAEGNASRAQSLDLVVWFHAKLAGGAANE
jgi:hypothetical protein